MSINFNAAMILVNKLSVEELSQLNRDQLLFIVRGLTSSEISDVMFAKNIKIFGGINGYVNNFLSTGTITKIKAMSNGLPKTKVIEGAIQSLNKMLTYDSLTDKNRIKINDAILQLSNSTAPAAGRYRRNKRRTIREFPTKAQQSRGGKSMKRRA